MVFAAGHGEFAAVLAFVVLSVGIDIFVGLAAVGAGTGVVEGSLMPGDNGFNGCAGDAGVNGRHYQTSDFGNKQTDYIGRA
jgi:hypothetical protein